MQLCDKYVCTHITMSHLFSSLSEKKLSKLIKNSIFYFKMYATRGAEEEIPFIGQPAHQILGAKLPSNRQVSTLGKALC